MKPSRALGIFAAVVVVVVALVVSVGSEVRSLWFGHHMFETAVANAQASMASHRDEFMKDQDHLARLALFAPRGTGRDAGPIVSPHIRFAGVGSQRRASSEGGGTIDSALVDKIGAKGLDVSPEEWSQLDFAWMAELHELDFWDVDAGGVSGDLPVARDAEPLGADLVAWAKIRIAKGIHEGSVGPALGQVEDLARLCFTTERYSTQQVGLLLLGLVNKTQRDVLAAHTFQPSTTHGDLESLRRAAFAALAFARIETPAAYTGDFDRIAVGKCAALHDGAWLAYELRPDLEGSRQVDYQRLEGLLSSHPECRLRVLRDRWAHRSDGAGRGRLSIVEHMRRWIPGVRRVEAETMVAISDQGWFRGYERVEVPPPSR